MRYDELLENLFACIDRKDAEGFAAFLTPDGTFRFGSGPVAEGRDAVRAAVDGFFATVAGLSHRLHNTVLDGDTLIMEGEVTYTRHDGSEITLPFANVFEMAGDLIRQYKVYADVGPLYAD